MKIALLSLSLLLLVSCDQQEASTAKESNIIDYATGAQQINVKKKTEEKLKNIQNQHNQLIDQAAK